MIKKQRMKSPKCPSFSLEDAISRTEKMYEANNNHLVLPDAAAESIGYKNAGSGAAKTMLAALSAYKLINRSTDGKIQVSDEFTTFKFCPDSSKKYEILNNWLHCPKVFGKILKKYKSSIPVSSTLKYDFIEMGFSPRAADDAIKVLIKSIEFVKNNDSLRKKDDDESQEKYETDDTFNEMPEIPNHPELPQNETTVSQSNFKDITIFLPNSREAILKLPRPFYMKDREVIKRQIEALLADDEEF